MDLEFDFALNFLKVRTLNDYLKRLKITTKRVKLMPPNKNSEKTKEYRINAI